MDRRSSTRRSRDAWSTAWRRLGDPVALSQSAAWWFAPVGFIGPVLSDSLRLGGSAVFWVVVASLGQLVVAGGFWLGQRTVARLPRSGAPLGTLGVVLAVVLARGVLLAWMVRAAGYTEGLELVYRTVGSIPIIGGSLIVSGLVACARSEHRAVMQSLGRRRDELILANAQLDGRLAEIQEQLRLEVHSTLDPRIGELETALDAAVSGRASVPVAELRALVDDDLRGLIRELATDQAIPTPPHSHERTAAAARVRFPATMAMSRALRPGIQGAMVGAAATASVARALPVIPAVAYCLTVGLLTAGGLMLARLVVARWTAPTMLAFASASAIGAVATFAAVGIADTTGMQSPGFIGTAALAYGAACALALAIYRAADDHRSDLEIDLAETVAGLESSASTLQRRAWVARRRLSLLLHGSIQGALHAAVIRLAAHPEPDPEDIIRVRKDVAAAFALLDAPPIEGVDLAMTLDSITETWAGHCDVTWSISAEAGECLDADSEARECVAEIAREGTHNAIVHGGATQVCITVTRNGDRIAVAVSDNGRPTAGQPGTGTAMLEAMCSSWSRSATSAGTVLHSELAV